MNRTVFSLPERSEYRTSGGLAVLRVVEHFSGAANRLDELIDLLDRRRGVVLSSGTTLPDRLLAYDRATARGVVLSYDFAWKGNSTEGLSRETAESVYAKAPRQGYSDHT